jgi:hypothetical protein
MTTKTLLWLWISYMVLGLLITTIGIFADHKSGQVIGPMLLGGAVLFCRRYMRSRLLDPLRSYLEPKQLDRPFTFVISHECKDLRITLDKYPDRKKVGPYDVRISESGEISIMDGAFLLFWIQLNPKALTQSPAL